MKKFKLYKLLTITLLLSVSVFCYLYLTKLSKEEVEVSKEVQASKEETVVIPQKEIYYNTLPKSPIETNDYSFQNIGGENSEKLIKAYQIKEATYVILSSDSNGYDIKGDGAKIIVAKLQNLTLNKTLNLCEDEEFLDSKILNDGIAILTSKNGKLYLYKIGYDLINTKRISVEYGTSGSLYLDNNELYILTFSDTTFNFISTDFNNINKVSTTYISAIEDFYVFKKDKDFSLIINTNKGYQFLNYNINSGFSSSNTTLNYHICNIIPYGSGYAGIYKKNGDYSIFTASSDLIIENVVELGSSDYFKIFPTLSNIGVILTRATSTTFSVYCKHLDLIYSNSIDPIQNIVYFDYSTYSFIGFFDNEITEYTLDNFEFTKGLTYPASNTPVYKLSDGTISFTSNYKNSTIIRNYGSDDIILICKKN